VSVPTLLIISGPIASGKSTVAQLLATEFRASGHTAAVVDLDRQREAVTLCRWIRLSNGS